MENKIIKENFWRVGTNGDKILRENDLGWSKSLQLDAQSDNPETIFRYLVEIVGFNLLFYWVEDENFYVIETEKSPIPVRRLFVNPNWDGYCEFDKVNYPYGPSTCAPGEILASFDDCSKIWDELKISGKSIGYVLQRSMLIEWD